MRRNLPPHSEDNRVSAIKAHLCAGDGGGADVQAVYSFLYKHITLKNVENVTGAAGQQGFK